MTDTDGDAGEDGVRVWLVERTVTDRGLLSLVYATPDGERAVRRERAPHTVDGVTAALTVDPDDLAPTDADRRERFADEARRMADRHAPDDRV